jgi:hypothetical protein
MAATLNPATAKGVPQLHRELCRTCMTPVLVVIVHDKLVVAEISEWEPRRRCTACMRTRHAHPTLERVSCARCGDSGYVGAARPNVVMLAIDLGWSDDDDGRFHVRLIDAGTRRRRGEALYSLHACRAELRFDAGAGPGVGLEEQAFA